MFQVVLFGTDTRSLLLRAHYSTNISSCHKKHGPKTMPRHFIATTTDWSSPRANNISNKPYL